jgi:hypothetical protein
MIGNIIHIYTLHIYFQIDQLTRIIGVWESFTALLPQIYNLLVTENRYALHSVDGKVW